VKALDQGNKNKEKFMNKYETQPDGTNVLSIDLPEEVYSYAENLLAEIQLEDRIPSDALVLEKSCLKQIVAAVYGIGFSHGMDFVVEGYCANVNELD
jgi:hypothetical protein